jgi:DNA-binding transcriptional MerR regulator
MMQIRDVAALVGATPRAIRHYHRTGVVPEPARQANGYRAYGPRDVVTLLKVRRMLDLGLPLANIGSLLRNNDGRSPRAVLQALDAELAEQAAEIAARREALRALLDSNPTDDPLQRPELAALIAELGARFPASSAVDHEVQALELLAHIAPEHLGALTEQYQAVLADPDRAAIAREIERRFTALADHTEAEPGMDAEIDTVARLMAAIVGPMASTPPAEPGHPRGDLAVAAMMSAFSPAQRRCAELASALAADGQTQ